MSRKKPVVLFAFVLAAFFCVTGLGLFAPNLRATLVSSVLGQRDKPTLDEELVVGGNAYLELLDHLPRLSDRLTAPVKTLPNVQFPDLEPQGTQQSEPAAPVSARADLVAKLRQTSANGPDGNRVDASHFLYQGKQVKFRIEVASDDLKEWIETRAPGLKPKYFRSWNASIVDDKISVEADLEISFLNEALKTQLPPAVEDALGDHLRVDLTASVRSTQGKGIFTLHSLDLGNLPISETMKWAMVKRVLEAQGRQMPDPKVILFDLPPDLETISIKDNVLLINEKYKLKMK